MKTEQLIKSSEYCCGCSACEAVCPKGAILMSEGASGFTFPKINEELCIDCGACLNACAFKNSSLTGEPKEVYACKTAATDIKKSSSGGAFACIAEDFINRGGAVYGAATVKGKNGLTVKHVKSETKEELLSLLGSKYVQSDAQGCYKAVKADLENGKAVLFSGTPCQVDGLYGYLKKNYDKLYTADIICHGVPSMKMLGDYLKTLESKSRLTAFVFRSKEIRGEMTAKAVFENGREKLIPCNASSYFYLFINGYTYRESCYACKYAGKSRVGDITLGDFWGIEEFHPEFNTDGGVSCLLINTDKGNELFDNNESRLTFIKSDFEKVAKNNAQLKRPSKKPAKYGEIIEGYKNNGYADTERRYSKLSGSKKYISNAKLLAKKFLK